MFSDSFRFEKLKLNELKVSRNVETESKNFPFKHFQPAKEQSLQKTNLVFLYLNSETTIFTLSFVICRSLKSNKSNFLSFKICEELSAKQTSENQQIQSNRQV